MIVSSCFFLSCWWFTECLLTKITTCFCRGIIAAAAAKLKTELKLSFLTQLDKKRLTMCKQELVGKPDTHAHIETTCSNTLSWS